MVEVWGFLFDSNDPNDTESANSRTKPSEAVPRPYVDEASYKLGAPHIRYRAKIGSHAPAGRL